MTTYLAYIARRGSLIVTKYQGELDRQQLRPMMRSELGLIDAQNIEQARRLALALNGTEIKSSPMVLGRRD